MVSKEGVKHGQRSLCCVLFCFFIRLARRKFVIAMPKPPSFLRGLQQQCLKQKTSQVRKETQDKCRDFLVFLPSIFSLLLSLITTAALSLSSLTHPETSSSKQTPKSHFWFSLPGGAGWGQIQELDLIACFSNIKTFIAI